MSLFTDPYESEIYSLEKKLKASQDEVVRLKNQGRMKLVLHIILIALQLIITVVLISI